MGWALTMKFLRLTARAALSIVIVAAARDWLAAASVNGLLALEEKGVTVQRLTDEERAVFRKASLPVYDSDLMSAEDTALWKKLSDDNR